MNAVIIEDEQIAAQNLERLLCETSPNTNIVAKLQSVEESIEFFSSDNAVDVVFMDIHLADGLSFSIFDSVSITAPIIFTTAYDQYALDAFKVNSIDYLLKPINKDDLTRAMQKLHKLEDKTTGKVPENIETLIEMMRRPRYKSFFLIPVLDKLVPLNVNDIAYIYRDDKMSRAVTFNGQSHSLDKPLDAIFTQLDPTKFFRANRQYIIAHSAVKDITMWPLSKLHVSLNVETPEKIIVSRARVSEFKDWYTN